MTDVPTPQLSELDAMADAVELAAIPDYPSVPGPLGDLVACRGGLPAGLVGGAALAAAASVMPAAELHVGGSTWIERPIVWPVPLAPRGAGKTPAMDLAFAPVRELDEERHRLYTDELSMWLATPPKERGQPPIDPTRLVGDLTLEMLVRRLATTGGAATIANDELSMILRSLGEYKRGGGGDRGRILGLWSGAAWRYQRVTGGTDILIPRPVVSIVGTLQPPLHHLLGDDEDGLRPRWLPHLAALDLEAHERGGTATRSETWTSTIAKLYDIAGRLREWSLDVRTGNKWRSARRRWKTEAGHGTESASTSAALIKADVQCARIALVLAETLAPGAGGLLPPEAMAAAIDIVDFVMDSWRALPNDTGLRLSRRDEALDTAVARLVAWLDDHGGSAGRRTLQRAHVAGVRTSGDLDALIARYGETYPGTVTAEKPPAGGLPTLVIHAPARRPSGQRRTVSLATPPNTHPHSESPTQNTRSESFERSTTNGVATSLSVGVATGVAKVGDTVHTGEQTTTFSPHGDSGDTDLSGAETPGQPHQTMSPRRGDTAGDSGDSATHPTSRENACL